MMVGVFSKTSSLLALLLLLLLASSAAAAESNSNVPPVFGAIKWVLRTGSGNVPIYVQQDAQGNLVAVVYYGNEDEEEPEKQVTVRCPGTAATGPGVIECLAAEDNNNIEGSSSSSSSYYNLVVPFRFERDGSDGTVVRVVHDGTIQTIPFAVEYNDEGQLVRVVVTASTAEGDADGDTTIVVPFYTVQEEDGSVTVVVYAAGANDRVTVPLDVVYDENGSVTNVVYDDGLADDDDDFAPGLGAALGIVAVACCLLVVVLCAVHFCWCGLGCEKEKSNSAAEEPPVKPEDEDNETTACDEEENLEQQ